MLTQSWTCWCSVSQSWTTLSRSSWPRPLWRAVTRTWKIVPWSTKLAPALAGVVDTELLIFFAGVEYSSFWYGALLTHYSICLQVFHDVLWLCWDWNSGGDVEFTCPEIHWSLHKSKVSWQHHLSPIILNLSFLTALSLVLCCASPMYLTPWQRCLLALKINHVLIMWCSGLALERNNGNSLLWHCYVPLHTLQSLPSHSG